MLEKNTVFIQSQCTYESLDDVDWVLFFPLYVFFIIKTLECGVKLKIIHKITLKDTCTRPRKYEKVDQKNSELLSRNARSENAS